MGQNPDSLSIQSGVQQRFHFTGLLLPHLLLLVPGEGMRGQGKDSDLWRQTAEFAVLAPLLHPCVDWARCLTSHPSLLPVFGSLPLLEV